MYGRIAVVPGHYVEGVGLKPFKQLWVRKSVGGSEGLFGEAGSSHESRESLIQHLMYEGEHRGRHQLTELQQMSDMELNSLHNWTIKMAPTLFNADPDKGPILLLITVVVIAVILTWYFWPKED